MSTTSPSQPTTRKPKRFRWGRLVVGLLLLAVLGFAVYAYYQGKQEKPVTVTAEPAARRTIIQLVSATGKIQPEDEVKISPEVAGEIIELPVVDGQAVKKGDLLIRILPDTYKAQVAQQEAAVNAAHAMSLQNKAQLDKSREDLKRYTDLYARKVINDSDMTNYKTVAEVAEANYNAGLAQIAQAESLLSQSRTLLEKTSIFSPINGVISLLSVKLGERVVATGQFAGTEVMRVADLSRMEARVNVNENDVVNVKNDDEASHRHRRLPQPYFSRHRLPDCQHRRHHERQHPGRSHQLRGPPARIKTERCAAAPRHEHHCRHRDGHRQERMPSPCPSNP